VKEALGASLKFTSLIIFSKKKKVMIIKVASEQVKNTTLTKKKTKIQN
jgi:hypothetical protein